jgi:uncharacterized membrane protein
MDKLMTLEFKIAKFLRIGVLVAGLLMLIGWLTSFQWAGNPLEKFHSYSQLPVFLHLELALMDENWGLLISYVGLLALISLPVLRVLLTMILFIKQKEFILAGVAALVVIGLLVSFTFGIEL